VRPRLRMRAKAPMWLNYYPTEEPDAKEVIDLIKSEGRKAIALPGDLREEAFCQKLVEDAVKGLGGLDILINNAARQQTRESILDVSTEDFDATMKTNIYAPFWIIKSSAATLAAGIGHHRHHFGASHRSFSGAL
jgi:NAD(P)-dependent dehydrogenase (short-subunit alcohol dehydrogenase family)